MEKPDFRFLEALRFVDQNPKAAEKNSDCELVKLLLARKKGLSTVENALSRALEIYESRRQSKLLLEALLITPDFSIEKAVDALAINREVLERYCKYFFDTGVFRDRLDLTDYISELSDPLEHVTKKMASVHGFYFILAQCTGGDLHMTPLQVSKKVQALSYRMMQQAYNAPLTSEAAKEAKGWANVVKGYTDTIAKLEPSDAQNDFLAEFRVLFVRDNPIPDIKKIEGEVIRG